MIAIKYHHSSQISAMTSLTTTKIGLVQQSYKPFHPLLLLTTIFI